MAKFWSAAAVLAVSLGLAAPAAAQQFQSQGAVIDECRDVALSEQSVGVTENPLRGLCINATQTYLGDVIGRGLDQPVFDQTVSDLVVALANLLFNPECQVESEIAQAIALAGRTAVDPEQQEQIRVIFQTISLCDFAITAAIFTPRPNTFVSLSETSGTSASEN